MTATAAGTSVAPLRPRLPWILRSISVVLALCMLVLSVGQEEECDTVFSGALALALGGTGAFVASQHPSNPIAWILAGQGVGGECAEIMRTVCPDHVPPWPPAAKEGVDQ